MSRKTFKGRLRHCWRGGGRCTGPKTHAARAASLLPVLLQQQDFFKSPLRNRCSLPANDPAPDSHQAPEAEEAAMPWIPKPLSRLGFLRRFTLENRRSAASSPPPSFSKPSQVLRAWMYPHCGTGMRPAIGKCSSVVHKLWTPPLLCGGLRKKPD